MIWDDDISFKGYWQKVKEWYSDPQHFIGDPPIEAKYALDLIFNTLIDDKANSEYLTSAPESAEQIYCIMLELILDKYSRKYRQWKRRELI